MIIKHINKNLVQLKNVYVLSSMYGTLISYNKSYLYIRIGIEGCLKHAYQHSCDVIKDGLFCLFEWKSRNIINEMEKETSWPRSVLISFRWVYLASKVWYALLSCK